MELHIETNALDRAAELGAQPDELARLARSADAQLMVHRASAVAVTSDARPQRLVRLPASTALGRGALLGALIAVMHAVLLGELGKHADSRHAEGVLRSFGLDPAEAGEIAHRPMPDAINPEKDTT